jgi:hypothetical protein
MKYHHLIKRLAPTHDPRYIQAYIASWHQGQYIGTLPVAQFVRDVVDAAACIEMRGPVEAETLALNLGL